jgi:hypothetical protein
MKSCKKFCVAFFTVMAFGLISSVAHAGTPVTGYSSYSKSAAADDANKRARELSRKRFKRDDCITPARIESCKKDSDGGFLCTAHVANHQGSCGN